jgi:hypothetical protein
MMGRACDRCRHQRLKCNFARGARGSQRTDGNVGSNTGGEKRKAGPSGTTKKRSEGNQPLKRPRRDTVTIDPKMLDDVSEGSELDRVFKLVGDYVVAYDALADWYQKEKVRRAGRG